MLQEDGGDWPALWFSQDAAARLVIARDFTVLAANGNAVALIESSGVISLRDGALATRDRRSGAELNSIVADAGTSPRVGIVGAGGHSALLIDCLALGEDEESPVALVLRDLRASAQIECADLESMFGVTPGEHQVIVQLVKGHSSRDIAEEFGKSILTVRTHVKRAYGKIGVKTRGQLFAKLLPYLSIR
ncbi:MAG TPA: helix-turn-helix transcriptional regulator [Caulobacteraceae bacterium]|nr:helix-turn-helix transcriptional regulator [Caulobacteraceae bacterium]